MTNARQFIAVILSLTIVPLTAQQTGTNASTDGAAKFTTSTQLIVETVIVKDKSGNPVEGLTAKDFTITEDGKPQSIAFCEYEKLKDPDAEKAAPVAIPATDLTATKVDKVTRGQISPEKPGAIEHRDRRLLAMYFDMSAMPVPDQLRSLAAAQKFVQTKMTPQDLMAIMKFSGSGVEILNDFTDKREDLLASIQTLIVGDAQGDDEDPQDESNADTGAAFGQDSGEFNIFTTDRQLAALQTAVKMLGQLNEKKALIYFASGLRLNGNNNQAQMQGTVNAAIRANVSLYPIDARGLIAQAPMGDATKGSPGGMGMYSGQSAFATANNFQLTQDTLYALGADTGGKALLDNNDLTVGMVNAQKSIFSYYIIGYYSNNMALDGKYRKIKISLNDATAKLDYRVGYWAGKQFKNFNTVDKERQLEDALMLGDPITDLTIAMEVNYFQLNRAEYFVPVAVKIPGSELSLARKGGAERTLIDFIGEVKDEFGATVQNVRDKFDKKLSDTTAAELAKRPIEYDTGFTLLPGTYTIKFLARDAETGRIGTYINKFVIPNLNKEDKRIPISSVVLSGQRIDLHDSYNAAGKPKVPDASPLIQDGQKLMPSVTRVFSKNKDMYVYLQAYEPAATTFQPLVAFVTFYRGQIKAFETAPLPVTEGLNNRLKTVPLKFNFALNKLPTGRYNCQVTVIDPTTQKAAFWQAPVMLVP
ncbi:MAG TPA: VWA domain-containing protein [Bryobacteraceae bacterium]|jgi:VWFA-related protein